MQVERIRKRYFKRLDVDMLDAFTARKYKQELRLARGKLRKLPDSEPLRAEGLRLVEAYLNVMDAIIKNEDASMLMEIGRAAFHSYVSNVERVMRRGS